jgi:aspartate racemase
MQPVLGILGGMGPYATLDFIKNIYKVTPNIRVDSDHIRILSDINVKIPSRTRAILYSEESPVKQMIQSINNLAEIGASFVAVPCNSAHYFYDEVRENTSIEWVNMLELVGNEPCFKERPRALILGGYVTVTERIYDQYISQCYYLNEIGNNYVFQLIEDLKLSKGGYQKEVDEIAKLCCKTKAKIVILACTELTEVAELFRQKGFQVVDSNMVYAEGLVKLIESQDV